MDLQEVVLRHSSTADQVADGLTRMILKGKIAPGERLNETAVATSLGVSRNTVREAVRILESGGLVRRDTSRRGASVIEPSDDELADLYKARMVLEVAAAGVIGSPESIASVQKAFDALVDASELHQLELQVERDLEFHAKLVQQLGSARVDSFYAQIARELRFFLMVLSVEDREYEQPDHVIREHGEIVKALAEGRNGTAQKLVADLIQANEEAVRAIFSSRTAANHEGQVRG